MSLSLRKTKAIGEISSILYNSLPGQAHPFADQRISFQGIANELGLGPFWPGGSKLPAITSLLEKTLENRNTLFCPLILEIVRGIKYRNSKGDPITREEIQKLNNLILNVEFKIPELWDSSFLETLTSSKPKIIDNEEKKKSNAVEISKLCKDFLSLEKLSPQERGFAFERFLTEFFKAFDLNPRASFRNQGEQIDGSVEFENVTYLVEAKATWSRGIFISMGGFAEDGLAAFSHGKATNIIAINGQDIYFILEGKMRLDDVIRLKARRAAETGEILVSVYKLALQI